MDTKLWRSVAARFSKSDVEGAVTLLEGRLDDASGDRFKGLIGKSFSNSPRAVLSAINKFVRACDETFDVKAVYLEMNGFDINYDRWYFDSFGYRQYGTDPHDLEWLCDWQSALWPQVTLKGLEPVQKDFEWYQTNEAWSDKKLGKAYEKAKETAVLLVMTKFVTLIQSALRAGKLVKPAAKYPPAVAIFHAFFLTLAG